VPQVFARLLDYADKANIDLSDTGIRALGCGGAPLDPALKERVKRTFGVPIGNGYGATEMVPVCRVPDGVDADGDVVGQPQPGVEVLLMKEDGTQAKDGEVGEMWVRGPSLMSGYYRNEAETRAVMRPGGWLATGDLGMRMPDGAYRIAGRIKELIIRSGFNVYPVEVEAVLTTHPAVGQAAVVGRSVPGNEEVVAFVQLLPNRSTNAEELTAYLRERLAAYKVPCQVYIQELPIGPTGKILKIALRNQAQAAVAEPL
jgi:acyl-CoA synthetase (AMP-forming)/AMP-acid ligase II